MQRRGQLSASKRLNTPVTAAPHPAGESGPPPRVAPIGLPVPMPEAHTVPHSADRLPRLTHLARVHGRAEARGHRAEPRRCRRVIAGLGPRRLLLLRCVGCI